MYIDFWWGMSSDFTPKAPADGIKKGSDASAVYA